jgi:hypothetical protein
MPRVSTKPSPEEFTRQLDARRQANAMEALGDALEAVALEVPPIVAEIPVRKTGTGPKLSVDALELARQVYYLQHGSIADCSRAIIAAHLADTDSHMRVYGRLQTWWDREGWPKRPTIRTFAIRDASHDGGLFRSARRCKGLTTGTGPAPAGKACDQSPMNDSDYCQHHDPRPEYVERRAREGHRLAAARMQDMVAIEPFQRWCNERRERLLAEARANGTAHFNQRGWRLLAHELKIDQSQLKRLFEGEHWRHPETGVTHMKAATIARYLEGTDFTFEDIYGFAQPPESNPEYHTCPNCGSYKDHASKTCRRCYEAAEYGVRCAYVTRTGHRCPTSTKDPSGYCAKCRSMLAEREERQRNPKPIQYRKSAINGRMLAYAIDEHLRMPRAEWVAARLWVADIEGVRGQFAHRRSLASAIVKQFRKLGLTNITKRKTGFADEEAMRAMLDELLREHGPLEWPNAPAPEGMKEIPLEPFRAWLEQRKTEVGGYKALSARTGINPDNISKWIRGVGVGAGKRTVWKATVDSALRRFGDGTTYEHLYRS